MSSMGSQKILAVDFSAERTELTQMFCGGGNQHRRLEAIATPRPGWSVSLLVGATWKEPALPIAGPLVLGATADVRLGQTPISLGAWGTTQGAVGVLGRAEF